ncbi:hypothetical protein PHMEG_00017205 [Phytophthora megakarya]|uniref:Uncharacterized protein n=1 Tax=Phytophthora megakarya TaxID=4795 RepID=A0A225VZH1_9STRA|nr:hypothetical protein PHMEG_00017205 [Phytophthora megakarya]
MSLTYETEYTEGKSYFLRLLSGNEDHELYRTFKANWDTKGEEWVMYEHGNNPHLGIQIVNKGDSIDELISTLILLQDVAEDDYLLEYHIVGSCPDIADNPELAALAMALGPFAFDLVVGEFTFVSMGRADYGVEPGSEVTTMTSRQTGKQYSATHKIPELLLLHIHPNFTVTVPSCDVCAPLQPQLNGSTSVQLYYEAVVAELPVNDIAVGNITCGEISVQTVEKSLSAAVMQPDIKYSKAKVCMDKIIVSLTAQINPTFRAALQFLNSFEKTLHEGRFHDFLAGLTPTELAVVMIKQTPTGSSDDAATQREKQNPFQKNWFRQERSRKLRDVHSRSHLHRSRQAFQGSSNVKSPLREARMEAKAIADEVKNTTFQDLQTLLFGEYSWSTVKATMGELNLKQCDVSGPVSVRIL